MGIGEVEELNKRPEKNERIVLTDLIDTPRLSGVAGREGVSFSDRGKSDIDRWGPISELTRWSGGETRLLDMVYEGVYCADSRTTNRSGLWVGQSLATEPVARTASAVSPPGTDEEKLVVRDSEVFCWLLE